MIENDNEMELWQLVAKLREDLQVAMGEGEGKPIKFKLDAVELELKVAAKKTGEGKAGIKFWVVSAGAGGKIENERVQTLKLKMTPVLANPKPGGNRNVEISDGTDEVPS